MRLLEFFRVAVVLMSAIFLFSARAGHAQEVPNKVGENLLYSARWLMFDAGMVESSFPEIIEQDGRRLGRFRLHAWTTNVIANLFKMDDIFESLFDLNEKVPVTLTTKIRETHTTKDKVVTFDRANNVATVVENKDAGKTFPIQHDTQDFFTASIIARMRAIVPKTTIQVPVFEDNKNYDAVIYVIKKEQIRVLDGKLDTIMIIGNIGFEGAFDRGRKVYIWLSDDEQHVPVKLEMVFPFGNVVLTLVKAEGVDFKVIKTAQK